MRRRGMKLDGVDLGRFGQVAVHRTLLHERRPDISMRRLSVKPSGHAVGVPRSTEACKRILERAGMSLATAGS